VTENYEDQKTFYLTKIEMVPTDSTGNAYSVNPNSSVDTTISISEIFNFVKGHSEDFEKDSDFPTLFNPKPVNKYMLDDNGEPRVFYHGTNADFTVFDRSKSENKVHLNVLGDGNYFTAKREGAKRYGVHKKGYKKRGFTAHQCKKP